MKRGKIYTLTTVTDLPAVKPQRSISLRYGELTCLRGLASSDVDTGRLKMKFN